VSKTREISIVFTSLLFIGAAGNSKAIADVIWMGESWHPYAGSTLNVNGSNELEVTPGSATYGAGSFNTDTTYRGLSTPAVSFTYTETIGDGIRHQIWIEDEKTSGAAGTLGGWIQFGTWYGSGIDNGDFQLVYDDYDADYADDSSVNFSTQKVIDTGVAYSDGQHTVTVARENDGSIDFFVDGTLGTKVSASDLNPNFFGDIYLASANGTGVFQNFETGTFAELAPVPEPASIALLFSGAALAFGNVVLRGRRRQEVCRQRV
jgi:hypothetical protein